MKRLFAAAVLAGLLALPVAGASAGRGNVTFPSPDDCVKITQYRGQYICALR